MCDRHHLLSPAPSGEVEHMNYVSEQLGNLFLSSDYADIVFEVDNTKFHAHKVILAARSDYFRAMLFGGMKESLPDTCEVFLPDTSAAAFSAILRYIYTGRMSLVEIKEETLLDVLGLAHQYGFVELESAISDYLKAVLVISNVCLIYDLANLYNLKSLCQTCVEFIDRNAAEILGGESFLSLSQSSVKELIARDSFCAPEIDIFRSVSNWARHNAGQDPTPILEAVRLPLMTHTQLLHTVRPTDLVSPNSILDAIQLQLETRTVELKYRGFLLLEDNVATARHGAEVIHGEMKAGLLDGDCQNYDLDRGFTRHPIDDNNGQGIVVRLNQPYILNTIKLLLWDRDMRSYSYYVEISMDDKDYYRVVDHSHFHCRSWQTLHFNPRVARYVRVVGTHNTVNRVFHLVAIECLYTNKTFKIDRGLLVPSENVATIQKCAHVIEGVSRSRNALINGEVKHYDWDSGYTCHQLGSGAIIIQFAQPYMIGSIRLLLWDCDDRRYSYFVEVSKDQTNWEAVADRRQEGCKSWQTIQFTPRPVAFVKIVGTQNTANEVFHVVHFECPADPSLLSPCNQNSSSPRPMIGPSRFHQTPPPSVHQLNQGPPTLYVTLPLETASLSSADSNELH